VAPGRIRRRAEESDQAPPLTIQSEQTPAPVAQDQPVTERVGREVEAPQRRERTAAHRLELDAGRRLEGEPTVR
jgi:hypothetical protein